MDMQGLYHQQYQEAVAWTVESRDKMGSMDLALDIALLDLAAAMT